MPTEGEFQTLANYLNPGAATKLKSTGNSTDGTGLWKKYTGSNPAEREGTNESGFSGLPAGIRENGFANFWEKTFFLNFIPTGGSLLSNARALDYTNGMSKMYGSYTSGYSCRCLKDD